MHINSKKFNLKICTYYTRVITLHLEVKQTNLLLTDLFKYHNIILFKAVFVPILPHWMEFMRSLLFPMQYRHLLMISVIFRIYKCKAHRIIKKNFQIPIVKMKSSKLIVQCITYLFFLIYTQLLTAIYIL